MSGGEEKTRTECGDCFTCPFEDCISEASPTKAEFELSQTIERQARLEKLRERDGDKSKRERDRVRHMQNYYINHEESLAYKKAWRQAHKAEISAYNREYYAKNREAIRERQRKAYYDQRKAEKGAAVR